MKIFSLILLILTVTGNILSAQKKTELTDSEIFGLAKQNIEKYRKTDFSVQLKGVSKQDLKNIEIDVQQVSHEFLFGCIIFDLINTGETPNNEKAFKSAFQKLFNFAVFPFYWSGYESEPGITRQDKIMEVVQWCKQNGITTKGHPLVWTHEAGTPRWLSEYSTQESKKLLEQRVENIVTGFKNEIEIWDVINEVIHTVNWDEAMAENKNGIDKRYSGMNLMSATPGFIDSCFQWAHHANPDAQLLSTNTTL